MTKDSKEEDEPRKRIDEHKNLFVELLQIMADRPELIENEDRIKSLIAKINRKARKEKRTANKQAVKSEDQAKRAASLLFQANDERKPTALPLENGSDFRQLEKAQNCYICKQPYRQLHHFYHLLCPACARQNFEYRLQKADLKGRIALVTGGRIKIGQEISLMLLRWGAQVIVTTRFPENARESFRTFADWDEWQDRLQIVGLDLRNLPAVDDFIQNLNADLPHLDLIINNACQTIKRPLAFYAPLLEKEGKTHLLESETSLIPFLNDAHFPKGKLDIYRQQIDLRPQNSWTETLAEVSLQDMLEVQLVNVTAPFMLNSQLKSLLEKSPFERRFIVNVSAMEGVFNRKYKSPWHPHTNMAKAALNMMTRTSANDYAESGIYMNSVDTGWITDENPAPKRERLRDQGFVAPLDVVDGAARVLAPVVNGINQVETPIFGHFIKDYQISPW